MTTELAETGPIDYFVVEFPGNKMTGEGLPLLVELVDSGIIRILDLVFVTRELDGSVKAIDIADFDGDGTLDLAVFEGASSGLLGGGRHRRCDVGHRAGELRRNPGLRERLGRAVRGRASSGRSPARRQRTDPRPSHPRLARGSRGRRGRRGRSRRDQRRLGLTVTTHARQKGILHARSASRSRPHRGRRRNRHRRIQPRVPPSGGTMGRPGSSRRRRSAAAASARLRRAGAGREPADSMDDKIAQLKELGALHDAGVLTDAEFEAQKGKILYA